MHHGRTCVYLLVCIKFLSAFINQCFCRMISLSRVILAALLRCFTACSTDSATHARGCFWTLASSVEFSSAKTIYLGAAKLTYNVKSSMLTTSPPPQGRASSDHSFTRVSAVCVSHLESCTLKMKVFTLHAPRLCVYCKYDAVYTL